MNHIRGKAKYSESELVNLVQSGNRDAFNALYDNYSPALFGIISRIVSSEDTAQDVLQDTFVKIWKNIERYDNSKGTIFTWMLNIARNGAIDSTRSKHERNKIRDTDLIVSIPEEQGSEMNVDSMGIREVLVTLKPEYQLIINYLYIKGYTQEEAAGELNIPLGTVKTRARTAILRLRELLKEKQVGR